MKYPVEYIVVSYDEEPTNFHTNVISTFSISFIQIHLKINGGRAVEGVLRGFDPFMNLVIDESVEYKKDGSKNQIGMVVVRGNSVVMLEAKDRV